MYRLFCIAVLVTVFAATQAAPMRELSEKEAILRELLEDKKFWDWFGGDEETTDTTTTTQPTTEAPTTTQPTTEAPQPVPINLAISLGQPASGLTSNRICGVAQSLFPARSENVDTKRDLVINMIYDLCLPSVGLEDIEAFAMILDFLRSGGEEDIEPLVPTTPEPEEEEVPLPSAWITLLDKLAEAQNNRETLEDEEDVQEEPTAAADENNADTGADAGADADANGGATADANGDTGDNAGADANADAGADANTDAGVDANADAGADANADAGADTNADAGADANADIGGDAVADTDTEAGTGADGADNTDTTAPNDEGGSETSPAPAKREDAELLSLLLKAIELNHGLHEN